MKYMYIILMSVLSVACNSQKKSPSTVETKSSAKQINETQIADYVTCVFEDSKGKLWLGTIEKGLALYDGNTLKYFTTEDGLPTNRVTAIMEDDQGIFWLNTGGGLSKFDGKSFTNFPVNNDDFNSNVISQLLIDSRGTVWVGTWGGVYQFDGEEYIKFPIPHPKVKTAINEDTKNWVTEIKEEPNGDIWFARDGFGICKYDGKSFTHLLKKDGLRSNNVTVVEFDNQGNMWVGMRVGEKDNPDPNKRVGKGGVNKITNNTIHSFPEIKGFNYDDVHGIYKDKAGNIWFSTSGNGVYKYDGEEFKNYAVPVSIMSIMDDQKGNIWLGGAGGLYRINKNDEIINVTTSGPWE